MDIVGVQERVTRVDEMYMLLGNKGGSGTEMEFRRNIRSGG